LAYEKELSGYLLETLSGLFDLKLVSMLRQLYIDLKKQQKNKTKKTMKEWFHEMVK
jgi:hypothetical protein